MNDSELSTAVRESVADIHSATPVTQIITRGQAVRGRRRWIPGVTGALVVADPARRTCGAAAEILSRAAEESWDDLRAQPRRVTWPDVPIPFSPPLEEAVTVTADRLRSAVVAAAHGRRVAV